MRKVSVAKQNAKEKGIFSVGIDLGGTKLAAALVGGDGTIIDFVKVPVNMSQEGNALQTQKRIIQLMTDICIDFKNRFPRECQTQNLVGVGLASAGPLDVEKGTLINPSNFPNWKVVPIQALLTKSLQKNDLPWSVDFQNDAIAAAIAEGWIGAASQMKTYAVVTVGTGIGSGLILNGQPCQSRGAGSEFGHSIVDFRKLMENPNDWDPTTVEGIASGTALMRRARAMGFKGSSVEELVHSGSKRYEFLFDEMAWALACLCFNLSIGFHPEGIFISGGLIKIKNLFLAKTQERYSHLIRAFNPAFECKIKIAKTKNQAGVLGAARLPLIRLARSSNFIESDPIRKSP